jgi:RNase P/RNase MRP subunit p30
MNINNIPIECLSTKDINELLNLLEFEISQRKKFNTNEDTITKNRNRFKEKYLQK